MKLKRISVVLLVVVAATLSLVSMYWVAQQARAQVSQRIAAKANAVLVEVQTQAAVGNVREVVIANMQNYMPLFDAGKFKEAEVLLDQALQDLGVEFDPSTMPASPETSDSMSDDQHALVATKQRLVEKSHSAQLF